MRSIARVLLLLGVTAFALAWGGRASAGTMTIDNNLHFELGDDTAYIHTSDTITSIPLRLYWAQNPISGTISNAWFTFTYDHTKFHYVSSNGNVTYSRFKDSLIVGTGNIDTLILKFEGTAVPPSTTPVVFAYVHFTAVTQTAGTTSVPFYRTNPDVYNRLIINGISYSPGAWKDGSITVNTTVFDDPNLHFALGDDTTFMIYSSSVDSVGRVSLSIWWDSAPPTGTITNMCFKIAFDDNELYYQGVTSLISPQFTVTRKYATGPDTLILTVSGLSLTPPTTPLTLATLNFWIDDEMEHTVNNFVFRKTFDSTRVVTSNGNTYSPGANSPNYKDGTLVVADYSAAFRIDTVKAYLGQTVLVPVYLQSNCRLSMFHHLIKYDTTRLEFLNFVLDSALFPSGLSPSHNTVTRHRDTLITDLVHDGDFGWGCFDFTHELTTPQWLYKLRFKVKSTQANLRTTLKFLAGSASEIPLVNVPCYTDPWVEPIIFDSGAVIIPKDTANFLAIKTDANRTISKNGNNDNIGFSVKIKNGFPAGINPNATSPNDKIRVIFDLGTNWKYTSVTQNGPLRFSRSECGLTNLYDVFSQQYTGGVANWADTSSQFLEMFSLNLRFDTTGYLPTNYLNRFVKPLFKDSACGVFARVQDTTSPARIEATKFNQKLSWANDSVEVLVGEFNASYANVGGSSYYVTDTFAIRNNFTVGQFSVKVNVTMNHNIVSIVPFDTTRVHAEYLGPKLWRIFSVGSFSQAPNGNNYTNLARMTFVTVGRCMKPNQGYTTSYVTFSEPLMKDMSSVDQYTILMGNLIGSRCDYWPPIDTAISNPGNPNMRPIGLPTQYMLYANRPNPFNPSTTINYDLPENSAVVLEIYNILGEHVNTLVDSYQPAGRYEIVWNGRDVNSRNVASGIYLYRLRAGSFIATKKMSLIK